MFNIATQGDSSLFLHKFRFEAKICRSRLLFNIKIVINLVMTSADSAILDLLRREGALSRWELHERTGLRPNSIGEHISRLIESGVVCEQAAESDGPGRPRVPLTIDPSRRHVVGAVIRPGHVGACRVNLHGQLLGSVLSRSVSTPGRIVSSLKQLLTKLINEQTYAVGLSMPGFFDPQARKLLFSSALDGRTAPSLESLDDVIGQLPFVIENDMHALAARWLQTFQQPQDEDVLLVYLDDGQLGAAMLINGRPNRGCLAGGNELGHMRLPVTTGHCYCGHTGCLERIVSSDYLKQQGGTRNLHDAVVRLDDSDEALMQMIELFATGLANTINFMRPNRLVLVSELTRYPKFTQTLFTQVRTRLLVELAGRVRLDHWDQPQAQSAETAGWLALASVYHPDWMREATATLAAM